MGFLFLGIGIGIGDWGVIFSYNTHGFLKFRIILNKAKLIIQKYDFNFTNCKELIIKVEFSD